LRQWVGNERLLPPKALYPLSCGGPPYWLEQELPELPPLLKPRPLPRRYLPPEFCCPDHEPRWVCPGLNCGYRSCIAKVFQSLARKSSRILFKCLETF
jgi:hypothetical protein